jgi:DNA-binding transcriptional LysR family regulator
MFEKRSELIKFLAVVETGKIQLTAEKLNTTQPALSRIISKLEGQFKGQLFERIPTGVRVTPFGEHIAEQARHILREIEFAEAEVNGAITGRTGNLRITAGPMWMQSIMPKVIKSFHAKYPGIELQIRTTSYKEGILHLSSGESDLHCGAFGSEEPLPQFLKRERIIDMQVGIVAHDTHPIFQKEKVTYHDLVRFPWLTLDEVIDIAKDNNGWPTFSMVLDELYERTGERVKTIVQVDAAGLFLMSTGPYLTYLSLNFAQHLSNLSLKPIPFVFGFGDRTFRAGIVARRSIEGTYAFRFFKELVRTEASRYFLGNTISANNG